MRTRTNPDTTASRMISDTAASADSVVDRAADSAHDVVARTARAAYSAAEAVERGTERLAELQRRYIDDCRDGVRASPLAAVGIAVAAGVLVGFLLNLRR